MTEFRIVNAEALVVGPEDRLLLRIPEDIPETAIEDLWEAIGSIGIKERCLIVHGMLEFTKVEAENDD